MKKLDVFTDKIYSLHQRDIVNFFECVYNDSQFRHRSITVGNCWEEEDKKNPLMKTIYVEFQSWKTGSKEGEPFVWKSYRAKSFACNGMSINKKSI